ncbi:MAG TPA: hypothetical protein G4O14_02750 [Anaerolineae bacterium]|nr:hypothetical protein [Anaerolineae bacterium]
MGNKSEIHTAYLPIAFERTLDLRERAQQASQLQQIIGQFVIELLSNGKPLTIGVNVERQKPLADKEQYLVLIYWKDGRVNEVLQKMDIQMFKRCVKCGNPCMEEKHECRALVPNPVPEAKAVASDEILKLGTLPSSETEPASMD